MWEVVELLLSRPGLAVHPEDQQSQTSDVAEERVMRKMAGATNQKFLFLIRKRCALLTSRAAPLLSAARRRIRASGRAVAPH
jgi:hypothetical protein